VYRVTCESGLHVKMKLWQGFAKSSAQKG